MPKMERRWFMPNYFAMLQAILVAINYVIPSVKSPAAPVGCVLVSRMQRLKLKWKRFAIRVSENRSRIGSARSESMAITAAREEKAHGGDAFGREKNSKRTKMVDLQLLACVRTSLV